MSVKIVSIVIPLFAIVSGCAALCEDHTELPPGFDSDEIEGRNNAILEVVIHDVYLPILSHLQRDSFLEQARSLNEERYIIISSYGVSQIFLLRVSRSDIKVEHHVLGRPIGGDALKLIQSDSYSLSNATAKGVRSALDGFWKSAVVLDNMLPDIPLHRSLVISGVDGPRRHGIMRLGMKPESVILDENHKDIANLERLLSRSVKVNTEADTPSSGKPKE